MPPLDPKQKPDPVKKLWAIEVDRQGGSFHVPTPTYKHGQKIAAAYNRAIKEGSEEDATGPESKATPAEWPGTPEEHEARKLWALKVEYPTGIQHIAAKSFEEAVEMLASHNRAIKEAREGDPTVAKSVATTAPWPGTEEDHEADLERQGDEAAEYYAEQERLNRIARNLQNEAAARPPLPPADPNTIPPPPGGRTASIESLNYAAQFYSDAKFAELYAIRRDELIERFTDHPDIGLLVIDRLKQIKP